MPQMYPQQDGALFQGPATGAIYRATGSAGVNIAAADEGYAIAQGWRFAPQQPAATLVTDSAGNAKSFATNTGAVPFNTYGAGGFTTILLGDSIMANGCNPIAPVNTGPATGAFRIFDDRCWFEWANILSGHVWSVIRNAGIGGQTSAQILARVQSDVIAYAPYA